MISSMNNNRKVVLANSFNSSFTIPLKNAFEKLGYNVIIVDYRYLLGNIYLDYKYLFTIFFELIKSILKFERPSRKSLTNWLVYNTCLNNKPSIFFAVKGECITGNTIEKIKRLGTITILWQVDPSFDPGIWAWMQVHARAYDCYVSCEPGSVIQRLKKNGFKNVLYMLGAADGANVNKTVTTNKEYDISLVGTFDPIRERYLLALKGLDVHVWGWGSWDQSTVSNMYEGRALSQKEMIEIYSKSNIVVNIGRNPHSTIPTNLRPFEAAQAGSFILVDYTLNLKDVFEIGKEIDCFKTPQELREKVEFYLIHDKKRTLMARKLRNRVIKEHTYEIRLKKLLKEIRHQKH